MLSLKKTIISSQLSYEGTMFKPLIDLRQYGLSIPVFSFLISLFYSFSFYINYSPAWLALLPIILCSVFSVCVMIVIPKNPVVYFRDIKRQAYFSLLTALVTYLLFTIILLVLKLFNVIKLVSWRVLFFPAHILLIQTSASVVLLSPILREKNNLNSFGDYFPFLNYLQKKKWLAKLLKIIIFVYQGYLISYKYTFGFTFYSFFVNDWIWILHPVICLLISFFSKPPVVWERREL